MIAFDELPSNFAEPRQMELAGGDLAQFVYTSAWNRCRKAPCWRTTRRERREGPQVAAPQTQLDRLGDENGASVSSDLYSTRLAAFGSGMDAVRLDNLQAPRPVGSVRRGGPPTHDVASAQER
jgi:hypothetical protein